MEFVSFYDIQFHPYGLTKGERIPFISVDYHLSELSLQKTLLEKTRKNSRIVPFILLSMFLKSIDFIFFLQSLVQKHPFTEIKDHQHVMAILRITEHHRYIFTEKAFIEQTTRLCEHYYNSHFSLLLSSLCNSNSHQHLDEKLIK